MVGKGASPNCSGSSGVIVTRSGYVLSDGDAPLVFMDPRTGGNRRWGDEVEVRVLDLKRGTYTPFPGKVVRRLKDLDSCLVKVTAPPSSGFPFVVPGTADDLHVGSFTFAMGNAFGFSTEGTPTLTAGVVSALVPSPQGGTAGRNLEIYTSAAVNPGVNGGPLVDVEGALVGIVSTWVQPQAEPKSPYQFLGKVVPIDRVKDAYRDLPEFASIFPDPKTLPTRSKSAELLERALLAAARRAAPSVVSLEMTPSHPVMMVQGRDAQNKPVPVPFPRYDGPVSGVVVSPDGWIVTSLYNVANLMGLAAGAPRNDIEDTLKKITAITAHFPSGQSAPARVVAHHQRLGIALLKADVEGYAVAAAKAAPPESFEVGRLVLCCGNPFGAARRPDPLLTLGMFSRSHPADSGDLWRGDFQTDAGVTDTDCGGAMVDIEGRLLGVATLWQPTQQGRNSGIGFGIPWDRIEAALPQMREGKSYRYGNGYLGVAWTQDEKDEVRIDGLPEDGPAAKAGVQVGDRILAIDGKDLKNLADAQEAIRTRFAGDKVTLTLDRNGKRVYLEVELGDRQKMG